MIQGIRPAAPEAVQAACFASHQHPASAYMNTYIYIYISIFIYIYVHIYIYIHIYVYIVYLYILYIYIYIKGSELDAGLVEAGSF